MISTWISHNTLNHTWNCKRSSEMASAKYDSAKLWWSYLKTTLDACCVQSIENNKLILIGWFVLRAPRKEKKKLKRFCFCGLWVTSTVLYIVHINNRNFLLTLNSISLWIHGKLAAESTSSWSIIIFAMCFFLSFFLR